MKLNKQTLFLSFILIIGITAYTLLPDFEREEFNPNVVEDISSGNITTTTIEEVLNDENVSTLKLINGNNDKSNSLSKDELKAGFSRGGATLSDKENDKPPFGMYL